MAKAAFKSVDDYIASQPDHAKGVLQQVRRAIRKAVPGAQEVISYQIPAFRLAGGGAIFFAGWKEHFSLYPVTAALEAEFKEELARYRVSKGTLRFPLSEAVPERLIERIARARATEAEAETKAKKAATKGPLAKSASAGQGKGASRLRRPVNPMPDEVRAALEQRGLTPLFQARPDYQRNDYLGWIANGRQPATRRKRLEQMLSELERGGIYMNMAWRG